MISKILAIVAITSLLTLSLVSIGSSLNESAYATKCTTFTEPSSTSEACSTQGKNPTTSITQCLEGLGCFEDSNPTTHKRAAQDAVDTQQFCKQVIPKLEFGIECTTTNGK